MSNWFTRRFWPWVPEESDSRTNRKFYVDWIQDGGYGGAALCHAIIEAPNLNHAREHWFELVRATGVGASTYSSERRYKTLFVVPFNMQDWENAAILKHFEGL